MNNFVALIGAIKTNVTIKTHKRKNKNIQVTRF